MEENEGKRAEESATKSQRKRYGAREVRSSEAKLEMLRKRVQRHRDRKRGKTQEPSFTQAKKTLFPSAHKKPRDSSSESDEEAMGGEPSEAAVAFAEAVAVLRRDQASSSCYFAESGQNSDGEPRIPNIQHTPGLDEMEGSEQDGALQETHQSPTLSCQSPMQETLELAGDPSTSHSHPSISDNCKLKKTT